MKPQIIDRYVYVKGKKISEATSKSNLDGNEMLPLAYNDVNYNTTVDQISEYVDKVHDYLTTEDYNDLKGQIDSERINRQEADSELNQSIQNTKSELHSTISGVESELLGEVNDLQEQIDSINETGIAKGVTLDTAQTITGEKTFATVPKSTADATEDTDLVNKKYVDDAVQDVDVDLSGYATEAWVTEQGFARTSDLPEGLDDVVSNYNRLPTSIVGNYKNSQPGVTSDRPIYGSPARDRYVIGFYTFSPDSPRAVGNIEISIPLADVDDSDEAGLISAADKRKLDNIPTLSTSGDGTKYLSDNGTYKTIETPDLSNYLTEDDKTELETEIGDLSENVNGQITELQKKDSTIEGNVTNLTETVNTINDTVSRLDNKYLPLSGGGLTGDLTIQSANARINISDTTLPSGTATMYVTENGATLSNTRGDSAGSELILNDNNVRFHKKSGVDYYNILHEGNISGSKVTTNGVSGGLNITSITQSAYDELSTKDANTLYIITE